MLRYINWIAPRILPDLAVLGRHVIRIPKAVNVQELELSMCKSMKSLRLILDDFPQDLTVLSRWPVYFG